MTERKRPSRRGPIRSQQSPEDAGDDNPYRDAPDASPPKASAPVSPASEPTAGATRPERPPRQPRQPRGARKLASDVEISSPTPPPADTPRAEPVRNEPRIDPRVESRVETPRFEPPRVVQSQPMFNAEEGLLQRLERIERLDRADRQHDRPERIDRPERNDRPERPDFRGERTDRPERPDRPDRGRRHERPRGGGGGNAPRTDRPERGPDRNVARGPERGPRPDQQDGSGDDRGAFRRNGRRGRNRFRRGAPGAPVGADGSVNEGGFDRAPHGAPVVADGTVTGWFDASRDGGFLRRPVNSYLPDPADPFISPALVRLHQLRRGDKLDVSFGRDSRGRSVVVEVLSLNDGSPVMLEKRLDFNTLTASYPDRKLTLETGRPAKTGPELTRRAIDLIAPIGYGQRALIVAPARAGKTTLLQAIVEGVAINHPQAALLVLLVDERPEEVSEMVTWGYGEVVASSFDMPPKRHVEVADMTLERARRLVEQGKDVVIVLDSITRLARAHNTTDRGTGRTMSGGLDATAMQKPKAFFGSARMIAAAHGGGSLTIIATALVETGSRMDDVIFEEFKGTGNCEIKLDRSLADRRIFPAFDIATSGTRREEKLFRPDQLEKVHLLRRGLSQLPPQAGMEWLIKRIAGTSNNDSLLDGL